MYYDQGEFDIRCEWGLSGLVSLVAKCDVVVIVDVLSFSTCVDVAVGRGASVYPYKWIDEQVGDFAHSVGAVVASRARGDGFGLSPASLLNLPYSSKLVLPSPNGSTLSLSTGDKPTFAGCIRNAEAVGMAAGQAGRKILVVPVGERWEDGSLRFAIEDLIGAGAIISKLGSTLSTEARIAVSAFEAAQEHLLAMLEECSSGKELIERGFSEDVRLASMLNCSQYAPLLKDGAYQR